MPKVTSSPFNVVPDHGIGSFERTAAEMMGPQSYRPGVFRRNPRMHEFRATTKARAKEAQRASKADVPLPELSFLRRR